MHVVGVLLRNYRPIGPVIQRVEYGDGVDEHMLHRVAERLLTINIHRRNVYSRAANKCYLQIISS